MIDIMGVLSIAAGLYMLYKAVDLYREKIFHEYEVLFWSFFGIVAIILGIDPTITNRFLDLLNFTSRGNLLFSISTIAIYIVVLKLYIRNRRLQKELTELVRKIGIKKYKQKKNK